jgi:hypothetical protein
LQMIEQNRSPLTPIPDRKFDRRDEREQPFGAPTFDAPPPADPGPSNAPRV